MGHLDNRDNRPLDALEEFSTKIASDINDLPTTSPHGTRQMRFSLPCCETFLQPGRGAYPCAGARAWTRR